MSNSSLFADFTPEQKRTLLATYCQIETFNAGDSIIFKNSTGQEIFFVLSGQAVTNVSPDFAVMLESDSCFGEIAFIDSRPRTTKVVATENNTSIALMAPEQFKRLESKHPELAILLMKNLLRVLATRLRRTDEALLSYARGLGKKQQSAFLSSLKSIFTKPE